MNFNSYRAKTIKGKPCVITLFGDVVKVCKTLDEALNWVRKWGGA